MVEIKEQNGQSKEGSSSDLGKSDPDDNQGEQNSRECCPWLKQ